MSMKKIAVAKGSPEARVKDLLLMERGEVCWSEDSNCYIINVGFAGEGKEGARYLWLDNDEDCRWYQPDHLTYTNITVRELYPNERVTIVFGGIK